MATPQGLSAKSSGEKSRADDGALVNVTMAMRVAIRPFIFEGRVLVLGTNVADDLFR